MADAQLQKQLQQRSWYRVSALKSKAAPASSPPFLAQASLLCSYWLAEALNQRKGAAGLIWLQTVRT